MGIKSASIPKTTKHVTRYYQLNNNEHASSQVYHSPGVNIKHKTPDDSKGKI